jgi:hypothetical protein
MMVVVIVVAVVVVVMTHGAISLASVVVNDMLSVFRATV